MFPFVETLRIERGQVCNLEYHQRRMAATMGHFFPEAGENGGYPPTKNGDIRSLLCA